MSAVAEILEAAAVALMVPGAWTHGTLAREESGNPTGYAHREACQWCAIGAIRAAASSLNLSSYAGTAIYAAARGLRPPYKDVSPNQALIWWNDDFVSGADEVSRRLFNTARRVRDADNRKPG